MEDQKHIYDYHIDRQGLWFCEGNAVDDPALFRMLSRSIFESGGKYFVRCEGETHPVRVDDAPLWVKYVHVRLDSAGELAAIELELQDGRREELDPESLKAGDPASLYCTATPRRLRARLGKTAYYEIAAYIKESKEAGELYLEIAGRRYVVWKFRDDAE